MYTLRPEHVQYQKGVVVVGCGGTGGFVAEGLCRLLPRDYTLVLIDGDLVEPANLQRQNFYAEDLGRYKSQALAERLARQFQRPVAYGLEYLSSEIEYRKTPMPNCGLVIGCVDNALARAAIALAMRDKHWGWWVDAGNAENWGQVVIGNADVDQIGRVFVEEEQSVYALPMPTVQRPQLLIEPPVEEPEIDCAEAVVLGDQSPTINQTMAALVLEVARRLILGTCPWMSLFLDLDTGELKPTYATPEAVSRITGLRVRSLMHRPRNRKPRPRRR